MTILSSSIPFPKLRALDVQSYEHECQPYYLLQDPLELNGGSMLVPQGMGPILALCDGSQADAGAINGALIRRFGYGVGREAVEELLAALDHSFLLENERFRQAAAGQVTAWRQAPHRPPMLAGRSYPADPDALRELLDDYLAQVPENSKWATDWTDSTDQNGSKEKIRENPSHPSNPWPISAVESGRGLFSPHIDYPRGGPIYATAWKAAADLVQAAELVVIFATDHYGSDRFTLTRQHYATPFGVLPTDRETVDRLAQAIGPDAAFSGEMRHSREHSVELVAVWLHHMRGGEAVPIVPILTGGLHDFFHNGQAPDQEPTIRRVLETLTEIGQERRVLVVASGDMAHVGPAFGGPPLTPNREDLLRAADGELLAFLRAGKAADFFQTIAKVEDRNNVCGVTPFYLALSLMERIRQRPVQGRITGYDRCPADDQNTSAVTVCGVFF